MKLQSATHAFIVVLLCAAFATSSSHAQQQQQAVIDSATKSEISDMLRCAYEEVAKHYYDPKLQGIDWDARYKQYAGRIANAPNLGEGYRIVAAFLGGLKDSHTFFVPPRRAVRYDSGYRYALVGNEAFITQVRPNTDAAAKLHIGDKILGMNGFVVDRADYQDVQYYFSSLSPQMSMKFGLQSPTGEQRQVVVTATAKPMRKVMDLTEGQDSYDLIRQEENEDHASRSQVIVQGDVAIWKLQQFYPDGGQLEIDEIEKAIGIARKHKSLILDLRGNGGGDEEMLRLMVGSLFDHEIKIGDRVGRKEKDSKPLKTMRHGQAFDGKLIVLVDSESGSCSELLARVIQLEHRGTVLGDKSAGAVMEARYYSETMGADTKIVFGVQVTSANLIMSDGKSLEKIGVTPDELLLPTAADLAARRDPLLAHAVELAGGKLDAEAAGKLFPFEWLPI